MQFPIHKGPFINVGLFTSTVGIGYAYISILDWIQILMTSEVVGGYVLCTRPLAFNCCIMLSFVALFFSSEKEFTVVCGTR